MLTRTAVFSFVRRLGGVLMLSAAFFLGTLARVDAISATNVQPANLVQSNRTRVTITFTNAVTLPADGKIKIIFPAGYDVRGATNGTCSTMNDGFSTSVSAQTVTISRGGTGTAATAAAQSCTVDGIINPATLGSTGTYTIGLYSSSEALLEQDTVVAADTIAAPATIVTANVQPENQVEMVRSRQTVSFTTLNSLAHDGRILVTFPAGFNVSNASNGTCSTMDGGFALTTSTQTVILTRNGAGTAQAAAAESCTIDGIVAPATGTSGSYLITTQDGLSTVTDQALAVSGDAFFASTSLSATNVQPASLVAGALSTVTMSFTTVTSTPINGKIRVTFPSGYSLASAGTLTCATFTGSVSYTTSGQMLTISRSGGSTDAAGAESCTLTNVRNPQVTGSTGTYAIEVIDDQTSPSLIASDMAVTSDTITVGALASTNVQAENLVTGIRSLQTVNFTTANPIPANGRIRVTFPGGFSVTSSNSGTCAVMDGTFSTSVVGSAVLITRTGSTAVAAGSALTCFIKDVISPITAGAGGAYTIQTEDSLGNPIDSAAATSDTFVAAPALTITNVQPTSLVATTTNDNTISFTIAHAIPAEGKIKIIYPAGFDVSGATSGTCAGFDGTLTTSFSGQTVTLTRGGSATTNVASAKTCTINGIKNPVTTGATGTYTITVTDKADATVSTLASVTADTMIAIGALTSTDVQPASLVAGAMGGVTALFSAVNGIPTNGKIKILFPSGYDVSAVTDTSVCTGFLGSVSTTVSGQTVTLTRDNTSAGITSGSISCSLNNIRNPLVSGSTGAYTLSTTDPVNVLISTAAVAADTISAGVLTSTDVQPDTTLISVTTTYSIVFTAPNPVPDNGKIVIGFPVGFSLAGTSSTSLTCSGLSGSLSSTVAGTTLTALRSGGSTSTANTVFTCKLLAVLNTSTSGTAGTYLLRTTTNADITIDERTSVTADTFFAAGALVGADVELMSLATRSGGPISIAFTTQRGLPRDGVIRITFPAGFDLTNAADGGRCDSMDGTFSTAIVGQVLTIVRSGGTSQTGSKTCTVSGVLNPSTAGLTGAYAIELLTASNQLIESDLAVSGDTLVASSGSSGTYTSGGGGGGGSFSPLIPTGSSLSTTSGSALNLERIAGLGVTIYEMLKLADDGNKATQEDSAVYYIGADGLRHAFPNDRVYRSWFCNFDTIRVIPTKTLSVIPLGKNVTYRPGYRLVKFPSLNDVYAVSKGGVLRPIASEEVARALYGDQWNKLVEDVSEAFYTNYTFGPAITSSADYQPGAASLEVSTPSDSMDPSKFTGKSANQPFNCPVVVPTAVKASPLLTKPAVPNGFRFRTTLSASSAPSQDIRLLQEVLKSMGISVYPEQRVTGVFGPATQAAVERLQTAHGVAKTGVLDQETRNLLNGWLP